MTDIVLNTEAHPFPRFEMGKLFKTGWVRKERDSEGRIIRRTGNDGAKKGEGSEGRKVEVVTVSTPPVADAGVGVSEGGGAGSVGEAAKVEAGSL